MREIGGESVEELEEATGADARGRVRVGVVGGPVDDGGGRRRVAVDVVWGRTGVLARVLRTGVDMGAGKGAEIGTVSGSEIGGVRIPCLGSSCTDTGGAGSGLATGSGATSNTASSSASGSSMIGWGLIWILGGSGDNS